MSDYAPIYFPADRLPRTTSATVTKGQLLYVSGVDTVAPTSAATGAWIGVAAHDAASGAQVVVYTEGVHELAASGSITAGDNVIPAAPVRWRLRARRARRTMSRLSVSH
jgi:predicted RecA/RadA family phage recombinase